MAAPQIPNPPPTPNGGAWVELHRGENYVFYESEDGEASVELDLRSDNAERPDRNIGAEVSVWVDHGGRMNVGHARNFEL